MKRFKVRYRLPESMTVDAKDQDAALEQIPDDAEDVEWECLGDSREDDMDAAHREMELG